MSVAVLFLSFVVFLFVGFPVAYCLGISSLLYFVLENMPLVTLRKDFSPVWTASRFCAYRASCWQETS